MTWSKRWVRLELPGVWNQISIISKRPWTTVAQSGCSFLSPYAMLHLRPCTGPIDHCKTQIRVLHEWNNAWNTHMLCLQTVCQIFIVNKFQRFPNETHTWRSYVHEKARSSFFRPLMAFCNAIWLPTCFLEPSCARFSQKSRCTASTCGQSSKSPWFSVQRSHHSDANAKGARIHLCLR